MRNRAKEKKAFVLSKTALDRAKIEKGFETYKKISEASYMMYKGHGLSIATIGRAFQGVEIGWGSVVVLAGTLGVEPESLIVNIENGEPNPGDIVEEATEKLPILKRNTLKYAALVCLFVLISVSSSLYFFQTTKFDIDFHFSQDMFGKTRIVIVGPASHQYLIESMRDKVNTIDDVNVIVATDKKSSHLSFLAAKEKWNMQILLHLDVVSGNVFDAIHINWHSENINVPFYSKIVNENEISAFNETYVSNIGAELYELVQGVKKSNKIASTTNLVESTSRLQNGMDIMFFASSFDDFNRAIYEFKSALELNDSSSEAYALLCEAHARSSWMQELDDKLRLAEDACVKAKNIQPSNPLLQQAYAYLFKLTNRTDEALQKVSEALLYNPNSAELLVLASQLYSLKDGTDSIEKTIVFAQKSILVEPENWRAYNELGRAYIRKNNLEKAVEAFRNSTEIVKHPITTANIGTLEMCLAKYDDAKNTYISIINSFEDNRIGYEMLGTVYFLKGNYNQAIENKLTAISKLPNHQEHLIWLNLATIYEANNENTNALDSFNRGHELLRNDLLIDPDDTSLMLFDIIYTIKKHLLSGNSEAAINSASGIEVIIPLSEQLQMAELMYLAWAADFIGQAQVSTEIWSDLIETCPMYKDHYLNAS